MSGGGAITTGSTRPDADTADRSGMQDAFSGEPAGGAAASRTGGVAAPLRSLTFDTGNGNSATFDVSALPPCNLEGNLNEIMARLSIKIRTSNSKSHTTKIEVNQQKVDSLNRDALDKMVESAKQMSKAEKSGQLGKAFGWIAAALTLVVAVCTVNPALFAVAVAGIAMMVLSETGVMEQLAEKMGTEAFIALMVVLAVAMMFAPSMLASSAGRIGAAAGAGAGAGGAAKGAATGAQAGANAAKNSTTGTQAVTASIQSSAKLQRSFAAMRLGADLVGSVSTGAAAVADANTAVSRHGAGAASAEARKYEARAELGIANVDDALELLEECMKVSDQMMGAAGAFIKGTASTNSIIHRNFA